MIDETLMLHIKACVPRPETPKASRAFGAS